MNAPTDATAPTAFETALDDAILRLQSGARLEDCLAAYPEFASDLRPLLEVATMAVTLAPVTAPPLVKARVRASVMAAAEEALSRRPWWHLPWLRFQPAGFAAAAASAALVFGSGGTLVASANALPGEPLYPVKRAVEEARVAVAQVTDPATQAALQNELAQRRIDEAAWLASREGKIPPGLIEAAARHAERAERAAGQLPEPKRGQVAAELEAAADNRTAVLERLLEPGRLPEQAQQAVAHAMEQGRKQQAERRQNDKSRGSATTAAGDAAASATPAGDDRGQPGRGGDDGGNQGRGGEESQRADKADKPKEAQDERATGTEQGRGAAAREDHGTPVPNVRGDIRGSGAGAAVTPPAGGPNPRGGGGPGSARGSSAPRPPGQSAVAPGDDRGRGSSGQGNSSRDSGR